MGAEILPRGQPLPLSLIHISTHAPADSPEAERGEKQPWRSAAEIIDWTLPCPSIFDTREQVREKYGLNLSLIHILGTFLASLPCLGGPWDDAFHRHFCDHCKAENCDACQHEAERNNPAWWLESVSYTHLQGRRSFAGRMCFTIPRPPAVF